MELNFPSPVTTGTVYTGTNSVTYIYDGIKWQGQIPVQSDLDTGLIHYYDNNISAQPDTDIVITTNSGTWTFSSAGTLAFTDGSVQNTAWTGTVAYSNITNIPAIATTSTLYKGTATFTLGATGILTLFRGSTIQDTTTHGLAFGLNAGTTNQGSAAVAFGYGAGYLTQGTEAVAVGNLAGQTTQGNFAIAIGSNAGKTNQHANSIVINATGAALNSTTASSFYIKPVRSVSTTTGLQQVWYNPTTGEFVYYTP